MRYLTVFATVALLALLGALAGYGYGFVQDSIRREQAMLAKHSRFTCDGRTYCSQMRSCEEAKFFLRHCPGVKMDGDRNGIPCESQWCSSGSGWSLFDDEQRGRRSR